MTDASVQLLAHRCRHLKVLKLGNAPALTDASLEAIGARCTRLTTLRLERCPGVGRRDAGLAAVAEHCKALTSLELGGCRPRRCATSRRGWAGGWSTWGSTGALG